MGKEEGRKQRTVNPKIRSILILKLITLVWSQLLLCLTSNLSEFEASPVE